MQKMGIQKKLSKAIAWLHYLIISIILLQHALKKKKNKVTLLLIAFKILAEAKQVQWNWPEISMEQKINKTSSQEGMNDV